MTGAATSIDAARVELLLNELRLPGVKAIWPQIAAQSDKEADEEQMELLARKGLM
jgi:hypothetical protein